MSGPIFGVAVLAFVLIPLAGAAGAFFILARMRATRPWRIVGSCLAALAVQALIFVAVAPPKLALSRVLSYVPGFVLQMAVWAPFLVICEIVWRRKHRKPQPNG